MFFLYPSLVWCVVLFDNEVSLFLWCCCKLRTKEGRARTSNKRMNELGGGKILTAECESSGDARAGATIGQVKVQLDPLE